MPYLGYHDADERIKDSGLILTERHDNIDLPSTSRLPPLTVNGVVRVKQPDKAVSLPSLCKQIQEPEAHPDFELVMARLKLRGQTETQDLGIPCHGESGLTSKQQLLPPSFELLLAPPTSAFSPRSSLPALSDLYTEGESGLTAVPVKQDKPRHSHSQSSRKPIAFDVGLPRPAIVYAATEYNVQAARYVTNADPRGFLPVYEYQLLGQTLMIDMETSYIFLAGICNALGPSRANLIKIVESSAELQPYVRKVQGGFLKIQGLWVPFTVARELARRVAWSIRFDLVPFFGYHFPTQCLSPNDPGFGDLRLLMGLRRGKRGTSSESRAQSQTTRRAKTLPAVGPSMNAGQTFTPYHIEEQQDNWSEPGRSSLGKRSAAVLVPIRTPASQLGSRSESPLLSRPWGPTNEVHRKRRRESGQV